jgi:WhiB family redox-sensing transcriptional regulator
MYWAGTTAVAAGAAEVEAESAPELVRSGAGPGVPDPAVVRQEAPAAEASVAVVAVALSNPDLACMDDPELFFAESPEDVENAKAICRDCPARLTCLAGAQERREPWGVWGGELLLRGEVVPRKRPRGRPRKTEVAA